MQLFKSIQVSQKHDLHRSSDSEVSRQARANTRYVYLFVLGSGSSPSLSFIIRDAAVAWGEGGDTGQVRPPPWMICKNCIDLTFHPVGALVIILKYLQLKIWFFGFRCNYLSYLCMKLTLIHLEPHNDHLMSGQSESGEWLFIVWGRDHGMVPIQIQVRISTVVSLVATGRVPWLLQLGMSFMVIILTTGHHQPILWILLGFHNGLSTSVFRARGCCCWLLLLNH